MADYRAGQVCATVANYAGMKRNPEAGFADPSDFMPGLAEMKRKPGPTLLPDKEAQSRLIMAAIFKKECSG